MTNFAYKLPIFIAYFWCINPVCRGEELAKIVSFDFSIEDFSKVKSEALKACLEDEYLKGVIGGDRLLIVLPPTEYKALLGSYELLAKSLNVQYVLGDGKNIPTSSIKKGSVKISILIRSVHWNEDASQCLVKAIVNLHWPNGELRGYDVILKRGLAFAKWISEDPQLGYYSKE